MTQDMRAALREGLQKRKTRHVSVSSEIKSGGGVMTFHDYGYLPPEFLKSYLVSE